MISFNQVLIAIGDIMPRQKKSTTVQENIVSASDVARIVSDFLTLYKNSLKTEVIQMEELEDMSQKKIVDTIELQADVAKSRAIRHVGELFNN